MELSDGSRVGIVGGGPAGSFTACFLLDLAERTGLKLFVDIYEPRTFAETGPCGCNMCGGIISESLVQNLSTEGIHLPGEVVVNTINAYLLHTDSGSVAIQNDMTERRIAAVYRGAGPRGAEKQRPLPWVSFDEYLLNLACERGARHVPQKVTALDWDGERPRVMRRDGGRESYDFLVGAVGLNGGSVRLFESMGFGYIPPAHERAYIAELYYGEEDVKRLLGDAMHVFLLNVPGMKFAAMTPKGHYATFIILGKKIDEDLVRRVMAHPRVRGLLPSGWEIPVQPCQCHPRINVGPPKNYFRDRVAIVGDCGVSRLYKDGIGAAYRTAKALSLTAITHGVSQEAMERFYGPVGDSLAWDNRLGKLLFSADILYNRLPFLRKGLLRTVKREQAQPDGQRRLSRSLWDTFTGSSRYSEIMARAAHPSVLWRLSVESVASLFGGQGPEDKPGDALLNQSVKR